MYSVPVSLVSCDASWPRKRQLRVPLDLRSALKRWPDTTLVVSTNSNPQIANGRGVSRGRDDKEASYLQGVGDVRPDASLTLTKPTRHKKQAHHKERHRSSVRRHSRLAMESIPLTSLSGLPVELQEVIISFLGVLDIARLQQASRHLRTVCERPFAHELFALAQTEHKVVDQGLGVFRADGEMAIGDQSILLRHQPPARRHERYTKPCYQPALIALLFSVSHHPLTRDQYTDLTITGANLWTQKRNRRTGFDGLHFPRLTRLEMSGSKVYCVEDVAKMVRSHASTLQELVLSRITVLDTVDLIWDWFDLLLFVRDELSLSRFETGIWQPQMYALTKMLDYRRVYFDERGKTLKWSTSAVGSTQRFTIEEAKLTASGRDAVREGITAHLSRMRGRARFARLKSFLGKGVRHP